MRTIAVPPCRGPDTRGVDVQASNAIASRETCESHSPVGSPGGAASRSYTPPPTYGTGLQCVPFFTGEGRLTVGSSAGLRVRVSGAGLGSLRLAQALRRADVDVQVFERDHSSWDRPQGYRLHMDSDGVGVLGGGVPARRLTFEYASQAAPLLLACADRRPAGGRRDARLGDRDAHLRYRSDRDARPGARRLRRVSRRRAGAGARRAVPHGRRGQPRAGRALLRARARDRRPPTGRRAGVPRW